MRGIFSNLILLFIIVSVTACGGENILTNSKSSNVEDGFENAGGEGNTGGGEGDDSDNNLPNFLTVDSPVDISVANASSYPVTGACDEDLSFVTVSVSAPVETQIVTCSGGVYSATLDVTLVTSNPAEVTASQSVAVVTAETSPVNDQVPASVSIASFQNINLSNVGSYDFSGMCSEESVEVTVSVGGVSPAVQPVCSGGLWSVTGLDVTGAPIGSMNIVANHVDSVGNSAPTANQAIVKDVTAPLVAVTSAPDINVLSNSTYAFSGTCSEESIEVAVSVGGVSPAVQPVCSGGLWSVTGLDVTGAPIGSINIVANHTDLAGNPASTATQSINKDIVIPTVTVTSGEDIDLLNAASYGFSGGCSENGRAVMVSVGGVSPAIQPVCSGGLWSVTGLDVTSASDGNLNIQADHSDAVGNSAVQAVLTVNKDMTPFMLWASATQTVGDTNVNLAADDLDWSGILVSNKFFEIGPVNTDEITVKEAGDYRLSLTLPLSSGLQRSNIIAQIKVNSSVVEGAFSASSYIRNISGHDSSSDHIDFILHDMAVDDVIEVQVQTEALAGTVLISGAAYLFLEPIEADKVFVATATQVTGGVNLNSADSLSWVEQKVSSDFAHSDVTDPEQVVLSTAGNYFVSLNIPMSSSVERASVKSSLSLDGVAIPGSSARQGYIRSVSDHNTSSVHWQGLLEGVSAGQVLEVEASVDAVAGTVVVLAGQAAGLSIEKIESLDYISLSAVDVAAGTNWNQASSVDWAVQNSIDLTNFSHSTSVDSDEVTVLSEGNYYISYTGSQVSAVDRTAVTIDIKVNGVSTGLVCDTQYIRSQSGHDNASCAVSGLLQGLSSGDVIRVDTAVGGIAGVVTSNDDSKLFILKK